MTERTYPREWYRVSRYGQIEARQFLRETAQMLVYNRPGWGGASRETREAKADTYGRWYPELAEAEQASAEIKERLAQKERDRLIRNAAPELLEALEAILATVDARWPGADLARSSWNEPVIAAKAAIAKARGQ